MGLAPKHTIKQIDRLLGNTGVNVWDWFTPWVLFVVAARQELVVALDWAELYNQGCCWYRALPMMREDRLVQLMTESGPLLSEHAAFREIFGLI